MDIKFNHDSLKTVNQRDLMNFTSHVVEKYTDHSTNIKKIYVNTSHFEMDPQNHLMCRVVIKFQCWKEKELGQGAIHYWICNRAVDFACSQQHIATFPPMPFQK